MFVLYQRRFENVPLVTPNGDVLVRELNFQVQNNRTWMHGLGATSWVSLSCCPRVSQGFTDSC